MRLLISMRQWNAEKVSFTCRNSKLIPCLIIFLSKKVDFLNCQFPNYCINQLDFELQDLKNKVKFEGHLWKEDWILLWNGRMKWSNRIMPFASFDFRNQQRCLLIHQSKWLIAVYSRNCPAFHGNVARNRPPHAWRIAEILRIDSEGKYQRNWLYENID